MAISILVELDDDDIDALVDAYNASAGEAGQITAADFEDNAEVVGDALRELMYDQILDLIDSENDEVFDFFVDVFDPNSSLETDYDDDYEIEDVPPRLN